MKIKLPKKLLLLLSKTLNKFIDDYNYLEYKK